MGGFGGDAAGFEQRRWPRVAAVDKARIRALEAQEGRDFKVLDLSPGGLKICTEKDFAPDQIFQIHFRPEEGERGVSVYAAVAWQQAPDLAGLKFIYMSQETETRLEELIQAASIDQGP